MRIIETFRRGKHADQSLNEDGMLVRERDGFAAVVDGVTSKSVRRPWQPTGGVVAKDLALAALQDVPADASMRSVQRAVDERFRTAYREHELGYDVFVAEPLERMQANAVVYSAAHGEAWLFGDCQILVNGVATPTVKHVDDLLGEVRAFAARGLALQREAGEPDPQIDAGTLAAAGGDPARAMIMPFLRLQSRFANRRGEWGYFVFDGFTDYEWPVTAVPVAPGDEVVLASDGYPLLRPTLAESEAELARLHREDPALTGHEYRSTKGFTPDLESFDDRTYLRFVA